MSDVEPNSWADALTSYRLTLEDDLNYDDISTHLISKEVVTHEQDQRIKKAKSSRRHQMENFLDFLLTRNEESYNIFIDILKRKHEFLTKDMNDILALKRQPARKQPYWKTVLEDCRVLLVDTIDVKDIKVELRQKRVLTDEDEEAIMEEPEPKTRAQKVRCFLRFLLRGDRCHFDSFLEIIETKYDFIVDELKKALAALEGENDEKKMPFWKKVVTDNIDEIANSVNMRYISDSLVAKDVITRDQLDDCTEPGKLTRKYKVQEFVDELSRKTKKEFDDFLVILGETHYEHLRTGLQTALVGNAPYFPAQEKGDVDIPGSDHKDGGYHSFQSGSAIPETTMDDMSLSLGHLSFNQDTGGSSITHPKGIEAVDDSLAVKQRAVEETKTLSGIDIL